MVPVAYEGLCGSFQGKLHLHERRVHPAQGTGRFRGRGPVQGRGGRKLLSHKGLNLPGAAISWSPSPRQSLGLLDFGLQNGIRVFGVSFVEKAEDMLKVKEFARKRGVEVYTVAKIERSRAIERIDQILRVTDAVMVARGDLGVEMPIEEIPVIQKKLIRKANTLCKPVVTATQMLLSMTDNTRPTRAESTDVANAILDGTDAVMFPRRRPWANTPWRRSR